MRQLLVTCALFILTPLGVSSYAASAPPSYLRDLYDTVAELRHFYHNCETEISVLQEKLLTQEQINDNLYKEQRQGQRNVQDLAKNKIGTLEQRLNVFESSITILQNDVQALKSHLEKQSALITNLQNKLTTYESSCTQQEQAIQHLQQAMQALTTILQQENNVATSSTEGEIIYHVKEGDSLGKIARNHNISIRVLKESNQLTSDRIRVGQSLKIPQAS